VSSPPLDSDWDALLRELAGPLDWRQVPSADARREWADLRSWVDWFTVRFVLDHRVVPPCWYRHGALVELLTALRDHHRCAFDRLQPPSAATEWHRVLRDLEPRLRDWASRTGCTRDLHRADVTIQRSDDAAPWEAHLAEDRRKRVTAEQAATAAASDTQIAPPAPPA
jgi:hypothetical protein